jgi:probable HAF family extracellular repeat protein
MSKRLIAWYLTASAVILTMTSVTAWAAPPAPRPAKLSYRIDWMGNNDPARMSMANGMNNLGDVVGWTQWEDGTDGAFIAYGPEGVMLKLEDECRAAGVDLPQGYRLFEGWHINDKRQIVGQAFGDGEYFCFAPANSGVAKFERLLPASGYTNADNINYWGVATAWGSCSWGGCPGFYTFAGDGIGVFDPIPFSATDSYWLLMRMNDNLSCVGYKDLANGSRCAVLYTEADGCKPLPWLKNPGKNPQASARDVNNAGEVVGYSYASSGRQSHAFRYTASGGIKDLGVLTGYWNTSARSINDKNPGEGNGDVLGDMNDGRGTSYTGFLYTDTTGMIDLKTTIVGGWPDMKRDLYVVEINNSRCIIGRIGLRACRLLPQ